MDVAVLFSGGKDSTMAVWAALEAKEDVKYLLSVKSRNDESYMFHVPNIHITDLLAQALEIPLMSVETDGIKEEELKDLKAAFQDLKDRGVEAIYTGALYSVYQKSRIEKLGEEVGLKIISPFWHVDELEYMRKIVSLGFKIIISGVAAWGLDESWLGREIDEECIGELVILTVVFILLKMQFLKIKNYKLISSKNSLILARQLSKSLSLMINLSEREITSPIPKPNSV